MKKMVLLAVTVAAFASCKKDYTCTCTATSGSSSSTTAHYTKVKKKDAKQACDAATTSYAGTGSCVLS